MKFFSVITVLLFLSTSYAQVANLFKDLIQFNLAGHPVLHKDQLWPFDPDVGKRRSRQYQELNGHFGEKAIERLGLGIDGYDIERLEAQRIRDAGHLNGVDYNGADGL
uniref:Uncharacterized protein LOC114332379 n=1 Tax=Diabrotica virgifera virgifera TaxID=50390 RepID=A0A6P7FYR9_DIAVI